MVLDIKCSCHEVPLWHLDSINTFGVWATKEQDVRTQPFLKKSAIFPNTQPSVSSRPTFLRKSEVPQVTLFQGRKVGMVPNEFAKDVSTCPVGLLVLLTTRHLGLGHHRSVQGAGMTMVARGAETSCQQGGYQEKFSKGHQKMDSRSGKMLYMQ